MHWSKWRIRRRLSTFKVNGSDDVTRLRKGKWTQATDMMNVLCSHVQLSTLFLYSSLLRPSLVSTQPWASPSHPDPVNICPLWPLITFINASFSSLAYFLSIFCHRLSFLSISLRWTHVTLVYHPQQLSWILGFPLVLVPSCPSVLSLPLLVVSWRCSCVSSPTTLRPPWVFPESALVLFCPSLLTLPLFAMSWWFMNDTHTAVVYCSLPSLSSPLFLFHVAVCLRGHAAASGVFSHPLPSAHILSVFISSSLWLLLCGFSDITFKGCCYYYPCDCYSKDISCNSKLRGMTE